MSKIIEKIQSGVKQIKGIYKERTFEPYIIDKQAHEIEFKFIIGDLQGEGWYAKKKELLEMEFVRHNMLQQGDIAFECGAHHGWVALLLSNWVGTEGKLVAFEANSKNYDILKKNLEINHRDNAVLEHKAVGSQAGKITIFQKSNGSIVPKLIPSNLRSSRMFNFIYGFEEVETIALDTYAEQQNLYPTFLKIDVEGYEFEVLKGARKILETAPKILLEIHTEQLFLYGTSVKDLFDLIDLSRYKTWIQLDDLKSPVEFDPKLPPNIEKRAHLYAIPK